MASDGRTPLGLNLWVGRDRPKMADFNSDNEKIDLACRSVLSGLSDHLENGLHPTPEQQARWTGAALHTGEGIATAQGMHGIRYYNGVLEVNVGGKWEVCAQNAAAQNYKVYGVCIDLYDSDPEKAVHYTDDAAGITPGSDEWDGTFLSDIKPCVFKDGAVRYYLDKKDYARRADGGPADIKTGADGDVMVEIPKIAYAIYTEGANLYVKITNDPDAARLDSRFCYNAHTKYATGDRAKLYIGAYLSTLAGGTLRSLSGATPKMSISAAQTKTYVPNGFDLMGFYPYTLLQCLFLIRFKSRQSQAALGRGVVLYEDAPAETGGTNARGMFYGSQSSDAQMKAFGIEDLWGNLSCYLEGVKLDAGLNVLTATADFSGNNWIKVAQYPETIALGYIMSVIGDNKAGFLMRASGATAQTGYCDRGMVSPTSTAICGGSWQSNNEAGIFHIRFGIIDTIALNYAGSRLMYL